MERKAFHVQKKELDNLNFILQALNKEIQVLKQLLLSSKEQIIEIRKQHFKEIDDELKLNEKLSKKAASIE